MSNQAGSKFKYFVGINSLAEIATREDRVCVLNILGDESRDVTPVSHAYSGGNIVFGTSPGRRGEVLETPVGDIPVYNNVREGLDDGHDFNCRRGLPAAAGGARRRRRADPRQPRHREDRHPDREDLGARRARNPRAGAAARRRRLRRQLPRRRRRLEPRPHRRRAGRRQAGRVAAQGLDRDLLQLRQLHHHHRRLPARRAAGAPRPASPAARTSTSTSAAPSSPMRSTTTRAARPR